MKVRNLRRYVILATCVTMLLGAALSTPVAAQGSVAPPVPYPDAPDIGVGGGEIHRISMDQLVQYKALPEYHQAPSLDKFVADGTLPPVKDRLPKEPAVMMKSGMKDGIGEYGDLWRGFSGCPVAGYNEAAGISMGWYGIESYTQHYNALVKTGPLFRVDQDIEPMPNIAKSWDWSADGKQLTMHLIEGAKWSDGVPFTADDVMFTWDGYIQDPNVASWRKADSWTWDGKPATLEKVDDYTVMFTFPVVKPLDAFYLMDEQDFDVVPAHQLKPLHPKYSTANPKPSYKDFANALAPDHLPIVTMGPWVITEYKTDELMIFRRNAYYWKVDEDGNQLPYMDEIQYVKGPNGIGRDLCTIAGNCDHTNFENPSGYVQGMTAAQDPKSTFNVNWSAEDLGFGVIFNYSTNLGIVDENRDLAVRTLSRDLRFRQALSYATDREGIGQSIMKGPFIRGWAGGLFPGYPGFDKNSVVYYPFDVASANTLLDEMGLKDTNNDGVREWTSGPMSGQPVVLQLLSSQDQAESKSIQEALVNQWAAVGIKINAKIIDSQTWTDTRNAGTWDIFVDRLDARFLLPFTNPNNLAPVGISSFDWNKGSGDKPPELMDFEKQLVDIINKYKSTFDTAERNKLMTEYNHIFTENVYDLGVFISRHGLGTGKRFKNIADGTPTFMYQWVEEAILLDQVWTPKDQQLPENRPDTIAVYPKS